MEGWRLVKAAVVIVKDLKSLFMILREREKSGIK